MKKKSNSNFVTSRNTRMNALGKYLDYVLDMAHMMKCRERFSPHMLSPSETGVSFLTFLPEEGFLTNKSISLCVLGPLPLERIQVDFCSHTKVLERNCVLTKIICLILVRIDLCSLLMK